MSLARSSPSYGTQPYPTALLDIYRSIRLKSRDELLLCRGRAASAAGVASAATRTARSLTIPMGNSESSGATANGHKLDTFASTRHGSAAPMRKGRSDGPSVRSYLANLRNGQPRGHVAPPILPPPAAAVAAAAAGSHRAMYGCCLNFRLCQLVGQACNLRPQLGRLGLLDRVVPGLLWGCCGTALGFCPAS